MAKVYSTEELIKILAEERRACMQGQRLNLTAAPTGFNPLLDKFLRTDGIQRFTAYHDFRATIHDYQRKHRVSGITWQQLTVKDQILNYPKIDDQLIALPSDMNVLKAARAEILAFWQTVTTGMELYLSVNMGRDHQRITAADVERIVQRTEWANLWKQGDAAVLELVLQLGWGQPEEAAYHRGFPKSGSEYIHAVNPGKCPIC